MELNQETKTICLDFIVAINKTVYLMIKNFYFFPHMNLQATELNR